MPLPTRRLCLLLAVGLVGAAATAAYVLRSAPLAPRRSSAGPPPILPLSPSPYLNTGPEARPVGSAACVSCHEGEHASYHRTGMAWSTAAVDPTKEAADATFTHAASGRNYEVARQDGQLRLRETRVAADSPPVVVNDFPLTYVVGSGRHAKTYLIEDGGFFVESPVSWYRSRGWAMSPGYDYPTHLGFQRPITNRCLFCHVGQFEVQGDALNRYTITEAAIGCERCHGPGSLHVAERTRRLPVPPGPEGDRTIVNPRRLSRELSEAICQQCHLSAELAVTARGRTPADFRPGLPLQDVIHVFEPVGRGDGMTVTGHVEQLHQSPCYQQSATLTCTTCHNPHGFPEPRDRVEHYRAACLSCHAEAACKLAPDLRRTQSPEDDCAHCHMPTGATDIPHIAFSHHRIGIHKPNPPSWGPMAPPPGAEVKPFAEYEPFHDLSRFDPLDQKRSLGLAHRQAIAIAAGGPAAAEHDRRAFQLLAEVWDAGVRDGPVGAALSTLVNRSGGNSVPFAEAALADPVLDGNDRCIAVAQLGNDALRSRDYERAAGHIRTLTRLRRDAGDWAGLARIERFFGREAEAIRLMEEAARIGGTDQRILLELAEWYDRRGDGKKAAEHRQRAGK